MNTTTSEKSCCGPTCCAPSEGEAVQRREAEDARALVEKVREHYGRIAEGEIHGCCGPQVSGCAAPESAPSPCGTSMSGGCAP